MSVKSRVPYLYPVSQTGSYIIKISVRDGPVENLWGRGEVSQLTLTKYSCYGLNKIHIHTSNLITKKIPAARKFPSPPPPPFHNFSNGPSPSSIFSADKRSIYLVSKLPLISLISRCIFPSFAVLPFSV